MAKCEFCDKGVSFGIRASHSHRRSNRPWKPNVKRVKAIVNGTPRHVYVCTRCLRSGKVTRAISATKQIRSTAKAVLLFFAQITAKILVFLSLFQYNESYGRDLPNRKLWGVLF